MSMYTPYTYLITHIPSGKRYYGVRWARNCHPSELWKKYFTSSRVIKRLIEQDGIGAFAYEVRRTFQSSKDARAWEIKVLRRLNVSSHQGWFNISEGGINFFADTTGTTHCITTRQKISEGNKGKILSKTTRQRMSEAKIGIPKTSEHIEKMRAQMSKKWRITLPDGSSKDITNLRSYCRDNGLDQGTMVGVANGRYTHHKRHLCSRLEL